MRIGMSTYITLGILIPVIKFWECKRIKVFTLPLLPKLWDPQTALSGKVNSKIQFQVLALQMVRTKRYLDKLP